MRIGRTEDEPVIGKAGGECSSFFLYKSGFNNRISKSHQYDQEWRMLLPTPYTNRPRIKFRPKRVLIGLRTPEYQRRLIIFAARIAGIQEIYQVVINDDNLLGKQKISEA